MMQLPGSRVLNPNAHGGLSLNQCLNTSVTALSFCRVL